MKIVYALLICLVLASNVVAETSAEKTTIYRSRSGGSASADAIVQKTQPNAQKDEMKARPSMEVLEKSEEKKTKKVYLSRSGGSAGTQTVEVPAHQ